MQKSCVFSLNVHICGMLVAVAIVVVQGPYYQTGQQKAALLYSRLLYQFVCIGYVFLFLAVIQ